MVDRLKLVMEQSAIYLGAVALLWFFLVIAGITIAKWCIKEELSWQRVVEWISAGMALFFFSVLIIDFLPQSIGLALTQVIIPNIMCAAALHALLLSVDRYMRHKYGQGIIQTRLVVVIMLIYIITGLFSVGIIKLQYPFFMRLSDIAVGYLTRTALVVLLILEILAGRCKEEEKNEVIASDDYTGRW